MEHLGGIVSGPRPGRMRDRRSRGRRGPFALPGPLSPRSVPAHRTPKAAFDALVGEMLDALEPHFNVEPDHVDVVVEEAPMLPESWVDEVPMSVLTQDATGARVVLFRLPIASRVLGRSDLENLVWSVLLERLGEVWHMPPDDLDPRR